MSRVDSVWTLLEVVAVVLVASLILGSVLGQPILLSYVTTGSMEPTLDPGDGFVAIPTDLAGPIDEGDVVTFRAEELHGGGLTTHRIVGETERGYITKGDANAFNDQDGDEPPVKPEQIVAVAWQPGGSVLVIPHVGTVVEGSRSVLSTLQRQLAVSLGTRSLLGTSGLAYLVFAVSIVGYLIDAYLDGGKHRKRVRDTSREAGVDVRVVAAGFALVMVLSATSAMVVPAGTQEYGIVSSEVDSPGPGVIQTGSEETVRYPLGNGGFLPVVAFLEPGSEAVRVEPRELRVPPRSVANATVTLSAPPETGYYRRFVTEHRYLAVLPQPHIRAMYEMHPWLPIVVIDALLGLSFYVLGVTLVDSGRVRRREGRNLPILTKTRRAIAHLWR